MVYHKDTVFVIGDAKSSQKNPITIRFNQFFIGLVIDRMNGRIVDVECSATINLTTRFVHSLLSGRLINDPDIVDDIRTRYFGSSQKALIVAFCDAVKKYNQIIHQ
ncbi:DUF3870 domain-containing protein [Sporolactobacillus shoreicorticis]|uniref:DUF3870 domain-containing protein n=1 Tax=Sporolactobacillus shoreicorticis TaxID=1923877 RepID=A0ABW5S6X6_9BACL|nr:DUF3870 domain-containing protein [Sporolactobacillus shoreicorticis]MCO7125708.1 DUF3870 domain-containing protein [Sporolactobacillus shoreicorticis]